MKAWRSRRHNADSYVLFPLTKFAAMPIHSRCTDPPAGEVANEGFPRFGTGLSRRKLVAAAAVSAVLPAFPGFVHAKDGNQPSRLPAVAPPALRFFDPAEVVFVNAAIARLIPADALGPGALEAGVAVFIDHQLAGPFGQAADWYMEGPWSDGTKQQGYQSKRTPAEVYRAAIAAIDTQTRHDTNRDFASLSGSDQDGLLHKLESGDLDLGDVSAKSFFDLLWQNTQEGYFADPIYLGNQGFAGWKLIGYPGPRYNYDGAIEKFGQRYPLPTVGLMGRDPTRQPTGPL